MAVAIILGALTLIIALYFSARAVNYHCAEKYDCRPFSLGKVAFMLIPSALFWSHLFFLGEDQSLSSAVAQGNLNVILLVILSVALLIGFIYYLAKKTSLLVAVYASFIQVLVAFLLIIFVIAREMFGDKRQWRR